MAVVGHRPGALDLPAEPGLQAQNDWPSIQYTFKHKAAQSVDFSPVTFLVQQIPLIGPLAIPVWIAGLYWLLRDPGRRALGIAAAVPLVIFLFAGKSYYVGPLHPFLISAGACAVEEWIAPLLDKLKGTGLARYALFLRPLSHIYAPR